VVVTQPPASSGSLNRFGLGAGAVRNLTAVPAVHQVRFFFFFIPEPVCRQCARMLFSILSCKPWTQAA
jgi:hypothetical protein